MSLTVSIQLHFSSHRALAASLAMMGVSAADFLTAPLFQILEHHYGWRGVCIIFSGFSLNTLLSGLVFARIDYLYKVSPMTKKDAKWTSVQTIESADSDNDGYFSDEENDKVDTHLLENYQNVESESQEDNNKSPLLSGCMLTDPAFLLLILSRVAKTPGMTIMLQLTPVRGYAQGLGANSVAGLVSALGVMTTLSRIFTGVMASVQCIDRTFYYAINCLASGSFMCLFSMLPGFGSNLMLISAYGLTSGM